MRVNTEDKRTQCILACERYHFSPHIDTCKSLTFGRCREKKHRCDGAKPVCSRCARLKRECEYRVGTVKFLETRVKELEEQLREKEEDIERFSLLDSPSFEPGDDFQAHTSLQAEYFNILNKLATIDSLVALLPPSESLFACVNRFSQRAQSCYLPRTHEFPITKQEIEHLLSNSRRNACSCPSALALLFAMLAAELQVCQYHMSGESSLQAPRRRSDAYGKPQFLPSQMTALMTRRPSPREYTGSPSRILPEPSYPFYSPDSYHPWTLPHEQRPLP